MKTDTNTMDDLLTRYYNGETTLDEERTLREAYRRGELPGEPVLAYRGAASAMPETLRRNIWQGIRARIRRRCLSWASAAAGIALVIGLCLILPHRSETTLALTDNMKRERFEDAMRIIGQVLDEKPADTQKVLYEDNRLIIAIE